MHHRRGLRRLLRDDALLERIERDGPEAFADHSRRRELCRYALKLTAAPHTVERADVERLRSVGLADADVLALCEIVAYYAYVNRIADGLGVELEPYARDAE